jgi:prepilin-type N-terminal cleavage/methylation domain-containing protein
MRNFRGFTLVELMVVVAIIAIIAAIAIPNLLSTRLTANETTAISTLRSIISAQAQFQTRGLADEDFDGLGEYGTFGEMSGLVGVRAGRLLQPSVLSTAFRAVDVNGQISRSGYLYRLYLPDPAGDGLPEVAGGGAPAGVDADLAESIWCVYAWPTDYGQSGVRTFFVNHAGEILAADSNAYTGPGGPPQPGAALLAGGLATSITGPLASGTIGRDAFVWRTVQN